MTTRAEAARELLERRKARRSLLAFTEYTHPAWTSGTHHARICEALEAVERGECKRLMIFAPPRHSKSELASKRFPAWYMGRHPDRQIIACSYNDDLATDFGRSVRNLVREREYRNVFPGVDLAADSTAAGRWNTSAGGAYISTGVGGSITGRGAHVAIIDDPIKNREDADSERTRDNVWKWYTSTFYTRLMPEGSIIMMLTRWHEDDLAGRALQSEDWTILNLPAVVDEDGPGESALWPEWYPLDALHHIRSVVPPRDWHALYQQNPRTEQGTYCKREWYDDRFETPPTVNRYMASDLAVTEPREGNDPDSTEHGVFGVSCDDTLYALDWWHGQVTPDVWIDAGIDLVAKHKPSCWFIEGGVIRRAVEPFLVKRMRERKVYCRVEWVNPISDKATRGRSFQGRSSMGKVRFADARWADRVIDNVTSFPGSKHDDAFDVCALIALVIDQAHPAIARPEETAKPRDHWKHLDKPRASLARIA